MWKEILDLQRGRLYNVDNGILVDDNGFGYRDNESLKKINNDFYSKFEEVKEDKIKLLLEENFSLEKDNIKYKVKKYSNSTSLRIFNKKALQYEISWGDFFGNELKDVQPLLDILNIEIAEKPKYVIDNSVEYTEEQIKELEKLGLKFKRKEGLLSNLLKIIMIMKIVTT